jgi:hypothetical protein
MIPALVEDGGWGVPVTGSVVTEDETGRVVVGTVVEGGEVVCGTAEVWLSGRSVYE